MELNNFFDNLLVAGFNFFGVFDSTFPLSINSFPFSLSKSLFTSFQKQTPITKTL